MAYRPPPPPLVEQMVVVAIAKWVRYSLAFNLEYDKIPLIYWKPEKVSTVTGSGTVSWKAVVKSKTEKNKIYDYI